MSLSPASQESRQPQTLPQKVLNWIWDSSDDGKHILLLRLRAALRIFFIVFREFGRDKIPLRAGALTYTIVLSLVPTLALGTAVLKGLGAGDQMRQAAYRFIDSIEGSTELGQSAPESIPAGELPPPVASSQVEAEDDSSEPQDEAMPPSSQGFPDHLRTAADQIFDYVDRTDFATLGAFGILGLVFAVLSVLGSIEQAMNAIWQAKSARPFGRKLMDYLALMILLPISINLALATETTLQNDKLLTLVHTLIPFPWVTGLLLKFLPLALVVLTFMILYRFIPNTTVKMLPALAGGIFGGICWLMVQALYIKLQIGVARYNAIYGSFATVPLFLLWMQLGWVVFLLGAEMSFAVQTWRHYSWFAKPLSPARRLSLALKILDATHEAFRHQGFSTCSSLAEQLKTTEDEVQSVLLLLQQGNLLRQTEDPFDAYVPSAPAEDFHLEQLVSVIFGKEEPECHPLAAEILASAEGILKNTKILTATNSEQL